jgi:hypothetical protein
MSTRGKLTKGGPPAWWLGVGLTTSHPKNLSSYETFESTSDLDLSFGMS